jgi:phosphatidate cytidylyltransferase
MLNDRLAIAIPLITVAVWVVWLGGPVYTVCLVGMFALAAREYVRIFRAAGNRPAEWLLVASVGLILLTRAFWPAEEIGWVLAFSAVAALLWHLWEYEKGHNASGTDFAITLGGIFYLGWMGSYFVVLRAMPDGLWWTAVLLGGVWLADSAAYIFGRWLGRHKLAARLSPKKTWEGFVGGIVGGAFFSALLAMVWHLGAGPQSLVNWHTGAVLGALVGLVGPIGDLGISMLKRQTGLKDSGELLAGHGGVLDRIDSWLVALPVGYYVVLLLQILFSP